MSKVYYDLIKKKLKTIDNVSSVWKDQVLEMLKEDGLDGYGNPFELNK